jgi:hypothetical protein
MDAHIVHGAAQISNRSIRQQIFILVSHIFMGKRNMQ